MPWKYDPISPRLHVYFSYSIRFSIFHRRQHLHKFCSTRQYFSEVAFLTSEARGNGGSDACSSRRPIIFDKNNIIAVVSRNHWSLFLFQSDYIGSLLLALNGNEHFVSKMSHSGLFVNMNTVSWFSRKFSSSSNHAVIDNSEAGQLYHLSQN